MNAMMMRESDFAACNEEAGDWMDELEAERLEAEGWPVLRGSPGQRDAAFVRAVLTAQLANLRRAS